MTLTVCFCAIPARSAAQWRGLLWWGPDAHGGLARSAPGRLPRATDDGEVAQLIAGKREENTAGSSNNLRGDVLRGLGVLKVATVEQIQQISGPASLRRGRLVSVPVAQVRETPPAPP